MMATKESPNNKPSMTEAMQGVLEELADALLRDVHLRFTVPRETFKLVEKVRKLREDELDTQAAADLSYLDVSYPLRNCDNARCGKPYRGPAVYCSHACAIDDVEVSGHGGF
jgi:hypothetical protein